MEKLNDWFVHNEWAINLAGILFIVLFLAIVHSGKKKFFADKEFLHTKADYYTRTLPTFYVIKEFFVGNKNTIVYEVGRVYFPYAYGYNKLITLYENGFLSVNKPESTTQTV